RARAPTAHSATELRRTRDHHRHAVEHAVLEQVHRAGTLCDADQKVLPSRVETSTTATRTNAATMNPTGIHRSRALTRRPVTPHLSIETPAVATSPGTRLATTVEADPNAQSPQVSGRQQ